MYGGAKEKCPKKTMQVFFCCWSWSYLVSWTTAHQDATVSYLALVAWLARICVIILYMLQAVGSSPVFVKHISSLTYCNIRTVS